MKLQKWKIFCVALVALVSVFYLFKPAEKSQEKASIFEYLSKVVAVPSLNLTTGLSKPGKGAQQQRRRFNHNTQNITVKRAQNTDLTPEQKIQLAFWGNLIGRKTFSSIVIMNTPTRGKLKYYSRRMKMPRFTTESKQKQYLHQLQIFEKNHQLPLNSTELLQSIRNYYYWPPSPVVQNFGQLPNTSFKSNFTQSNETKQNGSHWLPHDYVIKNILKEKIGGVFVETSANNGKTESDTLHLERKYGWTGLLIEPDPQPFEDLVKVYRNAWLANACVSKTLEIQQVRLSTYFQNWRRFRSYDVPSHCYPLYSLILAAFSSTELPADAGAAIGMRNNSNAIKLEIDYLSLNLEGLDLHLEILKTIPFELLFIRTISVAIDFYSMPTPSDLNPQSSTNSTLDPQPKFFPLNLTQPLLRQTDKSWDAMETLMNTNGYQLMVILNGKIQNYAIYAHHSSF